MFNLKKFTAVLVSLCLFITTLTELSYSSIGIFNDKDINVEGSIFNGFKTVDSSYKSDSHLLIIINDLHSNPGVQKSIYTFLNKLNAFNSLSKVFVEGAPYGEIKLLNTTYDIEGKNKRKIIDIMLSSGLISGAEVFGINNNFNKMYGIEQWDKYVENIQIAAKNYAKNDEDNFLTSIKESIYFNSKPEIKNIIDKNENIIKKSGENFSQVEYFGRMLLLNFFWTNALFVKSNHSITKSEIKKKIDLDSKFDNLFEILLIILEKEKFVNINGEIITSTDKVESSDLKKELDNLHNFKERLTSKYNDMTPHFNLLEICISNYPAILSGEKSPDGVMFPVYSMELVEGVFRNNILADYFNKLIAKMISSYLNHLSDKKVKILEIGAGSGGTSVFVLEELKKYKNAEYYFTDISKVFTRGAEKKFKEKYPFVHFKKLDIENEIESQGFRYEDFDIILGSNVVHSTKNIDYTLSQIKKLLSPSGLFILN